MSPEFIHLNLHTEYSIVDGIVRIDELMAACCEAKMPAIALTDQSNLFGVVKFYKAAIAAGIKPLLGVTIWLRNEHAQEFMRVGVSGNNQSQSRSRSNSSGGAQLVNHTQPFRAVLLAQNEVGYKNLLRLISHSYVDGQVNGKPQVSRAWLEKYNEGVIALSGALRGDIGQALLRHNSAALVRDLITWWQKFFPDRFYLELQRICDGNDVSVGAGRNGGTASNSSDEEEYIVAAVELAEQYALPVVATNAVCFLKPDDFDAHEARVCINAGYVLEDPSRPHDYTEQQYLRSPVEMQELFADIPEALSNAVEIAKRCNVTLTLGENFLPIFPVPADAKVEDYLEQQSFTGLRVRLAKDALDAIDTLDAFNAQSQYEERLKYELGVIKQMGFASYFLIVADFIHWAKNNNVPVGPGRGSGAGSLVAYALGITDLDPIKHDLLFERFLNPERVSLPDFDIDFCMEGRDRVIEYVVRRYGYDKVAQIITYGTMMARAAVRDVGRVLGYPYGFVDRIAKLIPFELGITLERALNDEEQLYQAYSSDEETRALIDLAKKLEGIVRNAGKHAGGVVIAPSQLTDFVPLYREEGDVDGNVVTQLDKDDVEAVGLVKFDFLGLRTLTIINWAVKAINAERALQNEPPLDINALPLDDAATYRLLQNSTATALFQLESRGMSELIKKLKPDCFDEIVALVALYRPGPLQSGMVDDFLNRKHGREKVTYLHPALEPILRATYGVILYQEQVMQIAQVLAGYSLGGADLLRRAMGKKKPEEMAKQRAIFLEGAMRQGVDKHVANTIFDLMEKFAGYGFNKSHSAAYALISYQTAWLKAHYPAEFMAAVLSSDMDNTDKVVQFIRECTNLGITIFPPDVNTGEYKFTVKRGGGLAAASMEGIVYGLGAVKGVGQAAIENICMSRAHDGAFRDLFDFCKRVDTRKVNRRVLDALIYAGAFDKIALNRASLFASLPLALQFAEQEARRRASRQMDIFSLLDDDEDESADGNEIGSEAGVSEAGVSDSNSGSDSDDKNKNRGKNRKDNTYAPSHVTVSEWSEEQKLQNEKNVLGFYLSGHPIKHYKEDLQRLVKKDIAQLTPEANKTVIIAGFVAGVRLFNTKRGNRLAVVNLEDDTGNIDLTIFSELYAKVREHLQEGQLVIAEAEVSVDDFSGGVRARAVDVKTLEQAHIAYAKSLLLQLEERMLDDVAITRLEQILRTYRGESCSVYVLYRGKVISNANRFSGLAPIDPSSLEFPRGAAEQATGMYIYVHEDCERRRQQSGKPKCEGYSAQIKLGTEWTVILKNEMLRELRELIGKKNVGIYY